MVDSSNAQSKMRPNTDAKSRKYVGDKISEEQYIIVNATADLRIKHGQNFRHLLFNPAHS
jgi:hypothetical protein